MAWDLEHVGRRIGGRGSSGNFFKGVGDGRDDIYIGIEKNMGRSKIMGKKGGNG